MWSSSGVVEAAQKIGIAFAIGAGVYGGILATQQTRMLYQARKYASYGMSEYYEQIEKRLGKRLVKLRYTTSQGPQVARVFGKGLDRNATSLAGQGNTKKHLWVLFPGNAQLALDWVPFLEVVQQEEARSSSSSLSSSIQRHFVLLDYPNYGDCAGTPSPQSIRESGREALKQLRAETGTDYSTIKVLGISLGCAAALEFAEELSVCDAAKPSQPFRVDQMILCCPFSSILDIAYFHRVLPSFLPLSLANLMLDSETRWDNKTVLHNVVQAFKGCALKEQVLDISLFHGTQDEICPVQMGRELYTVAKKASHGERRISVELTELRGVDHNSLLDLGAGQIIQTLLGAR